VTSERIEANPHNFWLAACGLDTYSRSRNHARLDTPWNAFTADRSGLVNSLWIDRIVHVLDAQEGRTRRFVRLGARSSSWAGQAIRHGENARKNLDEAIRDRIPVFGFEVEPNGLALERGERAIKHFYLDRVHQLNPVFGLRGEDLKDRLRIDDAFRAQSRVDGEDIIETSYLFELIDPVDPVPASKARNSPAAIAPSAPKVAHDDDDANDLFGEVTDKVTSEEYARRALPVLIDHVRRQRDDVLVPLTYVELAEALGRRNRHGKPWARGMGHVLGRVTAMVEEAAASLTEQPPYLTTIVVLSTGPMAGLPDKGVSGKWPGYDALSREDKQAKVLAEYARILDYGSRWDDILHALGLTFGPEHQQKSPATRQGGWGGGESEAHKALKRHVLNNPQLFDTAPEFSEEEHALRSGDEIDVFFRSTAAWVGVEVKSTVSDASPVDYERGIYQVVKYRSVLQAQALVDHPGRPPSIRVVLALGGKLPMQYRSLAASLAVEYVEGLQPLP